VATSEHRALELLGCNDERADVGSLAGRSIGAFCGIGNPAAFRRTLEALGATVVQFRTFPDHHAYTRDDVDELTRWAGTLPQGAAVATTQKDWVKLRVPDLAGRPMWAVRVGLVMRDGGAAFAAALERVVPEWL
jgi:tetraacyldisaccharide 4'-kinase